jgi:hypothetical protein
MEMMESEDACSTFCLAKEMVLREGKIGLLREGMLHCIGS